MAVGPGVRIGDAEREAMAASLREHYATGRLTLEEFQQRLDAIYAAKTDVELAQVTRDLPHANPHTSPWPPSQPAQPAPMPGPGYPLGAGQGYQGYRGQGYRGQGYQGQGCGRRGYGPFAWAGTAMWLLVIIVLLTFSWPFFGLPRVFLLVLAVFAFVRRIMRWVTGGARRR